MWWQRSSAKQKIHKKQLEEYILINQEKLLLEVIE